jgi:phosphoglycolate phosphatase-like HAD superfamily hydrolase
MLVVGDQFVDAELASNLGCKAILVARAEAMAHLDRLNNWKEYVHIVPELWSVSITGVSYL